MNFSKIHRFNAIFIGAFATFHLVNHLIGLMGPSASISFMKVFRYVYRNPIIEPILISAFVLQIFLGLVLIFKNGWPRDFWAKLQSASGLILVLFIIQHLIARTSVHIKNPHLDTNIFWASSVVSQAPFSYYFIPYYFLGVSALFAHIACAIHYRDASGKNDSIALTIMVFGVCIAGLIILSLLKIDLPFEYQEYLNEFSKNWR